MRGVIPIKIDKVKQKQKTQTNKIKNKETETEKTNPSTTFNNNNYNINDDSYLIDINKLGISFDDSKEEVETETNNENDEEEKSNKLIFFEFTKLFLKELLNLPFILYNSFKTSSKNESNFLINKNSNKKNDDIKEKSKSVASIISNIILISIPLILQLSVNFLIQLNHSKWNFIQPAKIVNFLVYSLIIFLINPIILSLDNISAFLLNSKNKKTVFLHYKILSLVIFSVFSFLVFFIFYFSDFFLKKLNNENLFFLIRKEDDSKPVIKDIKFFMINILSTYFFIFSTLNLRSVLFFKKY